MLSGQKYNRPMQARPYTEDFEKILFQATYHPTLGLWRSHSFSRKLIFQCCISIFRKKVLPKRSFAAAQTPAFAGVWAGRELTFGQHLFSENWKVKIEEEKGWKKECENAFCKIRNWKCKMPCEKKRIRRERWTITISLNIDFFYLRSKRKNRNLTCWDRQKNLRKMIWRKIL